MPGWQILLNAPFLLAGIFVKYLFFVKNGFGGDYVSGLKEGIRTRKQCRRVPGLLKRFGAELKVQFEMICGTGLYVYEFLRRQAAKRNDVFPKILDILKKSFIGNGSPFMLYC